MAKTDKPNVIVCLCDQLRAFDVGCYGSNFVKTPSIDKLAADGVRFEIACSNNPVCTPGRSILLSGQYSRSCIGTTTNCAEPVEERKVFPGRTLAEVYQSAGYRTGLIGKWHIEPHPRDVGFDWAFFPHHSHRYTGQTYFDIDDNAKVIKDFATDAEAEALDKFLAKGQDQPFFLYYNICQPHMPVDDMPERYKKMYSPKDVPLRQNVFKDGKPAYDERWFSIYLWDYLFYDKHLPYTEKLPEGFDLRSLTALYDGSIAWADDQLGALMKRLKANGLDENTLIVFTSDHGDNLGSHQLFNKDQLYEESIRIPMIYRLPAPLSALRQAQDAQRVVDTQVTSLVDVMPTLLSLSGLEIPKSVQGTDVSSVVNGKAETVGDNAAYIETNQAHIGIRTLTHLYGAKKAKKAGKMGDVIDDRLMFFDVKSDPLQMKNLAAASANDSTANEMRERLLKWDRDTGWLKRQL